MSLLENVNCPFCGSNKFRELFLSKDFLFSKEEFLVVKCQDCGLRYTNPRVKKDQIMNYYYEGYSAYKNSNLLGVHQKKRTVFHRLFGNTHLEILDYLRSVNAKSVLEIGPGNGELLSFLKRSRF